MKPLVVSSALGKQIYKQHNCYRLWKGCRNRFRCEMAKFHYRFADEFDITGQTATLDRRAVMKEAIGPLMVIP